MRDKNLAEMDTPPDRFCGQGFIIRAFPEQMMRNVTKPDLVRQNAFIGGEWLASDEQNTFVVTNPATGEAIAQVADCGRNETLRAIKAAECAFSDWAKRPAQARSALLNRWRELIEENVDTLAEILTAEMGKPLAEAKGEIMYGASYLSWFAEEAKRIYGETFPTASQDSRALVLRQPVGVCAAITPWNFPNAMLMRKAGAALAAGCTLVAKPAEDTPLSALAVAALAEEAGLPSGVINVVTAARPVEVGETLTSDPRVRKLSFTGSTEVGRILLRQSADTIKKASMELGGNAPFIVFKDADLDAAIDGAIASKFRNAGQTCVCSNRFLIQSNIVDEFRKKLITRLAELKVDHGDREGAVIGPLINRSALSKVERLVREAEAAGATVHSGGKRSEIGDLFYLPTVIDGVQPGMSIFQEEIFGPVAAIARFDTEEEAVRLANQTEYGLAAYFYTQDLGRAWRVGEALEYGMVGLNTGLLSSAAAPFGGVKQSGMGREGSRHGLEDYLELKYFLMGGLGT